MPGLEVRGCCSLEGMRRAGEQSEAAREEIGFAIATGAVGEGVGEGEGREGGLIETELSLIAGGAREGSTAV